MTALCSVRLPRHLAFSLLLVVLSTGCAGLHGPMKLLPGSADPADSAPDAKKVTVEIHYQTASPERIELMVASDASLNTALEKASITSRFTRMKLNVYRQSQQPGGPQMPLKAEWDSGKQRVPPHYDYHLHAGDRIVVTEDPSTILDDALGALLRPLLGE